MVAMRPIYQPLHGQAGVQASRWGDNPEACGIRVVVGITVGLLVSFAVVPLMFPGLAFNLEAGRQQQQMESKTLIIPLVETTTTTTLTSTTTTATTTTAAPPAPAKGRVPALVPALVPAATAARRESTTASRTTTTMATTTTTTAASTTPTTTTIATTATTETSTTTTTLTTTVSTATTTTTPSAARLARLKCQKQASDASLGQLRFPLSFECDEDGSCPSGWTCKGRAVACAADGSSGECAGGAPDGFDAKHYLSVGAPDAGQASLAASPIFMLPDGAKEVSISFAGDGPHAGMSLHMASNGDRICKAAGDKALRGGALSTALCKGLSLHGGQGVYLLIQSSGVDAQASLFVKDIHFLDQDGQDMDSALVIPGVKPKLPKLKEHKDSSSRSVAASWLEPPADCCEEGMPVIATYAGKDKLPYIDGAVMLGLSLQWHVPEFPRLCLVIKSMAQENKDLLTAAGWTLIDVDEWHPHQDHFAHDYWWMVYNKIDVFRVKVDKLLWLDSDMYVWDDSLREVLESTKLPKDHIAMVEDCTGKNFNSGLMLFEPSLEVYQSLREGMVAHHGWDGLDQPLINQEYSDRIVELGAKFNTHGSAKTCEGVVVAHYTGRNKPTLANVDNLRRVSEGFRNIPYSLKCPHLYEEFFCAMKNARVYLSEQLQAALKDVGKGHACMA